MKTTVAVELPGVRGNDGRLEGFEVWWDTPGALIPADAVDGYRIIRCTGREWYRVTLEFPADVLKAWKRKGGLVLWDHRVGEEITPESCIFDDAYNPVAALYYILLERGRYDVLSEEEGHLIESWWAFEE